MNEREQMDQAVERFEAAQSKLYRSDGTKHYSEEEHAERERAIRREFKAAVDAIAESVDGEITTAKESLLIAESADPTGAHTTEELGGANAGRPFVSDDVFCLLMEKLIVRCRAVLAQGERPAMFLYALYAGQRAELADDEEGIYELREVVAGLRRKLDTDAETRVRSSL